LNIPSNKLILFPDVYGPDEAWMWYFNDVTFPANLPDIWNHDFGQFQKKGSSVALSEFGGKYGHNGGSAAGIAWENALVDYLISQGIHSTFYWAWNPNAGTTGGLVQDDWTTLVQDKLTNLHRLWDLHPDGGSMPYRTTIAAGSGSLSQPATVGPSSYGQPVTVNMKVLSGSVLAVDASGSLQFFDGGQASGSPVAVHHGSGSMLFPSLTLGTHTFSATFTSNLSSYKYTDSITSLPHTQPVQRATLTIAADNKSRATNAENPQFSYSISGFVAGDSSDVISGAPVLTTEATPTSSPGPYEIRVNVSGMSATNYNFVGVNGTLTIQFETSTGGSSGGSTPSPSHAPAVPASSSSSSSAPVLVPSLPAPPLPAGNPLLMQAVLRAKERLEKLKPGATSSQSSASAPVDTQTSENPLSLISSLRAQNRIRQHAAAPLPPAPPATSVIPTVPASPTPPHKQLPKKKAQVLTCPSPTQQIGPMEEKTAEIDLLCGLKIPASSQH
jgi:hypothetical protein